MIQSGEGDWIINTHSPRIDSGNISSPSDCRKFMSGYEKRAFHLSRDFPGQTKKSLLRVLGASAVSLLIA
jgi:hypothetical protein